jgi:hypothetical protein
MKAVPKPLWFAAVVLAFLVCSAWAVQYGKRLAFKAMRIQLLGDLEVASEKDNPVLFEYLKSQYYYCSNRAGVRLLRGEGDFGAVDESRLQGFSAGKGPTTYREEYERYRHTLP